MHISYEADVVLTARDSWQHASSAIIHALLPMAEGALAQLFSRPHHNLSYVMIYSRDVRDPLDFCTSCPHLKNLGISARVLEYVKIPDTLSTLKI